MEGGSGGDSGGGGGEGSAVAKKFREQEEAMRRLNERLELRRQELSRRTQAIVDNCIERDAGGGDDAFGGGGGGGSGGEDEGVSGGDDDGGGDVMNEGGGGGGLEDGSLEGDGDASDSSSTDAELRQLSLEEEVLGAVGMAPESRQRLLSARLNVANTQLQRAKQQWSESCEQLKASSATVKQLQEELKKQRRRAANAEAKCQKLEHAQSSCSDEAAEIRRQNEQLKKDVQTAKKMVRQLEQQAKAKESKMNRALADAHRNREQLSSKESSTKANAAAWRSEKAQLEQENKKLLKHKAELLNIVRKQMKLIDIVQRQKAHIEAARLLSFTEEEFVKQLDMDQQRPSR